MLVPVAAVHCNENECFLVSEQRATSLVIHLIQIKDRSTILHQQSGMDNLLFLQTLWVHINSHRDLHLLLLI